MGEAAAGPLVEMLDSADVSARRNAAQALGWIHSPIASEALVQTLKVDKEAAVRRQAAWALGEIGGSEGMSLAPATHRTLERAQLHDPAAEVRAQATWALARIPEQAPTSVRLPADWASTLNRLQPVRWLFLALSLAGAAWLMIGDRVKTLVSLRQTVRYR
jgi:hypothetical protein